MRLRTKVISATSITAILGFGTFSLGPANVSKTLGSRALLTINSQIPKLTCYGKTDDLHNSQHVPLTVNVVARTICKGEEVHVSITIERVGDFFHGSAFATKAKSGFERVETNIFLVCKKGQTAYYIARSKHWTTSGRSAETKNSAIITCKGK